MKLLTWNNVLGAGTVRTDISDAVYHIVEKPELSFYYESLFYEPDTDNMFYTYQDARKILTDDDIRSIHSYIDSCDLKKYHCVDGNGVYIGKEVNFIGFRVVDSAPPSDGNYFHNGTEWQYIHGIDASGNYLGNVPFKLCYAITDSEPTYPKLHFNLTKNTWEDNRSIHHARTDAYNLLNLKRDEKLKTNVSFANNIYDSYLSSISTLTALVGSLDRIQWRTSNNQMILMTKVEATDLLNKMINSNQKVMQRYFEYKDKISVDRSKKHIDDLVEAF